MQSTKIIASLAILFFQSETLAFHDSRLDQCVPTWRCSGTNYSYEEGPYPGFWESATSYQTGYGIKCFYKLPNQPKHFVGGCGVSVNYYVFPTPKEFAPNSNFCHAGSIVKAEKRALGEEIALAGTPFRLVYSSDRSRGYIANRSVNLNIASPYANSGSTGVNIEVTAGSQVANYSFAASGSAPQTFTWNGAAPSGQNGIVIKCKATETNNLGLLDWPASLDCGRAVNMEAALAATPQFGGWWINSVHHLEKGPDLILKGDGTSQALIDVNSTFPSTYDSVSEDGKEIYLFDTDGKHIETRSALTNSTLLTIAYNSNGQLLSLTDAFSNVTTINYVSGVAVSIVGPHGQSTALTYDSEGNLASTTFSSNSYDMTYWPSTGLLKTFEKPSGEVSSFTYDADGRLLTDTSSAGPSLSLTESTTGSQRNIDIETDLGRTTQLVIKSAGEHHETSSTDSSGFVSKSNYGSVSNRLTVQPGYSSSSSLANDIRFGAQVRAKSSETRDSGFGTESFSYSRSVSFVTPSQPDPMDFDSVTTQITSAGNSTTQVYDRSLKKFTLTSPLGRVHILKINNQELPVESRDASFAPTNISYDTRGRPSSVTRGTRTTSFSYDTAGFVSSVTNALSQVKSFGYDTLGRVVSETLPDSRVIGYTYDAGDNLASVSPPSSSTHLLQHTVLGAISTYLSPSLGSGTLNTSFVYNNDRQLTQVTRPNGSVISYAYGSANGLLQSVSTSTEISSFTYGAYTKHKPETALSPDGITTTHYYNAALTPNGTTWSNSGSVSLFYIAGKLFSVTPSSNSYYYTYNADDLMTQAGSAVLARQASTGLILSSTLGDASETYTYDSTYGEQASYQAKYSSTNLILEDYVRDALGRISSRTIQLGTSTPVVWEYKYDSAGRLTEVEKDNIVYSTYTYDGNSNRTAALRSGVLISATYDAQDRLLTHGNRSFVYNQNGERTSQTDSSSSPVDTTTFAWDSFGNLKQVTLPTSAQINYRYDAFNRRVTRLTNSTVNEHYKYFDQLKLAAVVNSSGTVTAEFIYGERSSPEYMVKSGISYKFFVDHVGSVRQVVRVTDGVVVQEIVYDEFGRVLTDTAPGFQPFGFAGGLYDHETKLTQFGARWYDAEVGSWLSKDPILFGGGDTNLYGYVMNDPVNMVDPSGLLGFGTVNAGENYGEEAAQYWANQSENQCSSSGRRAFATGMGLFASLWTPNTSDATVMTLLSAYGLRNAGRPWALRDGSPARTVIDYGNAFRVEQHMIGKGAERGLKWHVDALWGRVRHWPWGK